MVTPRVLKVLGDWRVPLDQALGRYETLSTDGAEEEGSQTAHNTSAE
jgi:hypothetical protein